MSQLDRALKANNQGQQSMNEQAEADRSLLDGALRVTHNGIASVIISIDGELKAMPEPHVYHLEHCIRLEWDIGGADISCDVDRETLRGSYHALGADGERETTATLELARPEGWARLLRLLQEERGSG